MYAIVYKSDGFPICVQVAGVEPDPVVVWASERDAMSFIESKGGFADFQPVAEEILIVAAPGANPVDNRDLPYKRIRKGIRLMPLAEPFRG